MLKRIYGARNVCNLCNPYHCVPERAWVRVASTAGVRWWGGKEKKRGGKAGDHQSPHAIHKGCARVYTTTINCTTSCTDLSTHTVCCGGWRNGERKSCGVWGRWREAREMCSTRFYPTRERAEQLTAIIPHPVPTCQLQQRYTLL